MKQEDGKFKVNPGNLRDTASGEERAGRSNSLVIECIPSSERLHTSSQHHIQNKPTNQILLDEQNKYQCPILYKESFTSPSLNLPSVFSTICRIEIPIRAGEMY